MTRPLRIEFEGAWYHVMNRGANRQLIYTTNAHRNLFCTLLQEMVDQFGIEIHAFCLMNNHYHLLIRTPYANLSKAMRYLNGLYTQKINYLMERDGPLFRGRYKAILVDSDEYLLQVSRYIHLNPIKANICKKPSEFKWSSLRCYTNRKIAITWLMTSFILHQMGGVNPYHSYSKYVMEGIDERTENFYSKKHLSTIYGSKKFTEIHLNDIKKTYVPCVTTDINRTIPLPKIEIILSQIKDFFKISDIDLLALTYGKRNSARLSAAYLMRKLAHASHKEIARFLGIEYKSVSSLIYRINRLVKSDNLFKQNIQEIIDRVRMLNSGT